VLPEPDHSPTCSLEGGVDAPIPFHVPAELGRPVPLVRGGLPTVLGADVPEATVDEDGYLLSGEDDVRADLDVPQVQSQVLPVAEAHAVKGLAQSDLRLGVRTPVGPHVPGAALVEGSGIDTALVGPLPRLSSPVLSHTRPNGHTANGLLREDTGAHWVTASSGVRKGSQ